ncbi:MAG: thioredoxin domain-containing protein [Planctomycetes bacterium]|nr:thioredoxin domain-containing protein [Planctomycetota bacterium]
MEIDSILTPVEAKIFNYYFGVKENGNVKSDPHNEFKNENILYAAHSIEETAEKFNLPVEQIKIKLSTAKEKVNKTREQRPRPHLDDKIILSWNGLMISAFAKAYQVLGNEEYLNTAVNAGNFIINKLYNSKDEILLRRYRDGEARFDAHLEDYAFFIQGLLDLYEASFDIKWLKTAIKLNKQKIKLFYDKDQKGFFDISADDSNIIVRTKEWYDGAEPTGNSIAILNLLRLSQMTANDILNEMAANSLAYFGERIKKAPHVMPQFLAAVDFNLSKPKQIIIAGKSDDPHTKEILKEINSRYIPNKIILLADGGKGQKTLESYIPFIGTIKELNGKSTAYICENYVCQLPTTEISVIANLLNEK